MRRLLTIASLATAFGILGCGGSLPSPPLPSKDASKIGPHQGMAYALPDGQGYVEIVNEPKVEERTNKTPTALVVYFLGADAQTAMISGPSDVKFNLNPGKSDAQTIDLKPGGSADAGRFASEVGPFRVEDLRGELIAQVNGKPIKIAVVELH
jgi:hypothetical protein